MQKTDQRIAGICRDMGAANCVGPTLERLAAVGCEVQVFMDSAGKGTSTLKEKNISYQLVDDESDLMEKLGEFQPHAVVVGLSAPRGPVESAADHFAMESRTPLVHIEDYYGSFSRAHITPDLVVTIDTAAHDLVRQEYPHARIVCAGLAGIAPIHPRQSLVDRFDQIRKDHDCKIVVYTDGDTHAESGLRLFLQSLDLTRTPWVLLPHFHPKYVGQKTGSGTYGELWESMLTPYRKRGLVIDASEPADEVVQCADLVASGYSTLLFRALSAKKTPLTLWNDETKQTLMYKMKLAETPLMMGGKTPVITGPVSLDDILASAAPDVDLQPFDAHRAAEAVLGLL
ncbi:MAG: hypothetical protein JWO43_260 [Candidatus Adlerbacteria bacterium]|nr:hypothetical protein [Candidatus Adlerbacteria bacterium]